VIDYICLDDEQTMRARYVGGCRRFSGVDALLYSTVLGRRSHLPVVTGYL
jgi:hypothetical protein